MDLLSHLAQLSTYTADKQLCTNEVVLDCIYDSSLLGFEQPLEEKIKRVEVQHPFEKVNLGENGEYQPTCVNSLIALEFNNDLVRILKEYKDCFAWEYEEMPGLSRPLVEHRLPTKRNVRPIKQSPRRFSPEIVLKVNEEIQRLLKAKFIRIARKLSWISYS